MSDQVINSQKESQSRHQIRDIIRLFDECFSETFNTRLIKGADEPIYLPANQGDDQIVAQPYAQVVFAHGFYASALHEIAHWCLAGEQRRTLIDYGYWYCPDGRTSEQQAKFQSVEIKPQAIEWALSASAGFPFQVSCDNLAGDELGQQPDRHAFQLDIVEQLKIYFQNGFPSRAQLFMKVLAQYYKRPAITDIKQITYQFEQQNSSREDNDKQTAA